MIKSLKLNELHEKASAALESDLSDSVYIDRICTFQHAANPKTVLYLLDLIKKYETAIRTSLAIEHCAKTSCPEPCRAMCQNDAHKVLWDALERK